MTITPRRLDALEDQLNPQQMIVQFLLEVHRIPSFDTWWRQDVQEKVRSLHRLADELATNIRKQRKAEGRTRDREHQLERAVRKAVRDLAFLHHLHWTVNSTTSGTLSTYGLYDLLLWEQLKGLLTLEFLRFDLWSLRWYLSSRPYPLDPETVAALDAASRYRVEIWPDQDELDGPLEDAIEHWVMSWYLEQGKTWLPEGAHLLGWVRQGKKLPLGRVPPDRAEVRKAFPNEESFERWERGEDFGYGFADVPDEEFEGSIAAAERVMRGLAATGTIATSGVVELATIPMHALQQAPLIEGIWIDRYVVELAEWGARLLDQGYMIDPGLDEHWFAWHHLRGEGKDAEPEVLQQVREEVRGHLASFPGRTREVGDRPYLHLADYHSWEERRVPGELVVQEGIVASSWTQWVADQEEQGEGARLAGIPVEELSQGYGEEQYLILADPERLKREQDKRKGAFAILEAWSDRRRYDSDNEGTDRPSDELKSYGRRARAFRQYASRFLIEVYATQAMIEIISRHYFQGQSVLFPEQTDHLAQIVASFEGLVELYHHSIEHAHEPDEQIDLAELRRQAIPLAKVIVKHLVEDAKADAMRTLGEDEAAREIMLPIWLGEYQA